MWGHQVKGFPGAEFKSFSSREEAEQFTGNVAASTPGPAMSPKAFAHSPVPVKRSRSPGPGHPSNRAEVCLCHVQYCQDMILMSRVTRKMLLSALLVEHLKALDTLDMHLLYHQQA
jgi:hypothetical protein